MEEAYITKGFNNWKKALEAFVDHQQSKAHRAAITYESSVPQCGDVLEMTVNDLNNKHLAERKYLIKVMENIRFLACQGLAFRGNDGNDNLTQLFKLLNKDDPALLTRLDKESHLEPGPHKYIHTYMYIRIFFNDTDNSQYSRGREGSISTTSTRSRTLRHLFVTLHVR